MNKKIYLLFFVMMSAFIGKINAQVGYSVQALSGTYTPVASPTYITFGQLTTGTVAPSPAYDDGFKNNVPIPFTFTYNGTGYNKCHVCTNGFIGFGGTGFKAVNATTTAQATYCSSHDLAGAITGDTAPRPVRPILAPFWGDLAFKVMNSTPTNTYASNATAGVMYATTGTTPNRVFTMEFRNALWNWGAPTACMSFQIKLYETTNVIEFVYKQLPGSIADSGLTSPPTAGIGITAKGRGALNYISLQDTTSNPTSSRISETDILGRPATGQIYRFTPYPANYIDASVNGFSTANVALVANPQPISAIVINNGNTAMSNVNVGLSISGANTFTDNQTIATLNAGTAAKVTFNPFTPTNLGTNNITITIPSDSNNTDNSVVATQNVTSNTVDYTMSTPPSGGTGQSTTGCDLASKIFNTTANTIDSIYLNFTNNPNGFQPFTVALYDATGTDKNGNPGSPGSPLWTSASMTTVTGAMAVPVPNQAVTTDFFVVVSQPDSPSIGYAFHRENPLRSGTFYIQTPTLANYLDIATSNLAFIKLDMGVHFVTVAPVKLTKFTGFKSNNNNILKWITANETDNKGFEVLRSYDGKSYDKIAFVNSLGNNGNSNAELNYEFVDNNAKGTSYYRLKQIDKNGKVTLSEIVVIKGSTEVASIYPNPVASKLNLHYTSTVSEKSNVIIVDIAGKTVANYNIQIIEGANIYTFDVNTLKPGTYFAKMNANNGLQTIKFEKQ